jgi:hypothetical protein
MNHDIFYYIPKSYLLIIYIYLRLTHNCSRYFLDIMNHNTLRLTIDNVQLWQLEGLLLQQGTFLDQFSPALNYSSQALSRQKLLIDVLQRNWRKICVLSMWFMLSYHPMIKWKITQITSMSFNVFLIRHLFIQGNLHYPQIMQEMNVMQSVIFKRKTSVMQERKTKLYTI